MLKLENYKVENKDHCKEIRTMCGILSDEIITIGLGAGLDIYDYDTYLPLYIDMRVKIIRGKVAPVFKANLGYAFNLGSHSGGLMFCPGLNLKLNFNKDIALMLGIGLKFQEMYLRQSYNSISLQNYTSPEKGVVYARFVSITAGFQF